MTETPDKTAEDEGIRARLRVWFERDSTKNAILILIIINAITLGLGTSDFVSERIGGFLYKVDRVILAIFVLELSLKFYAFGMAGFRNAWNIFDLFVVVVGLMPQSQNLTALRGLRVIRAMRLLSAIPQMRAVVQALLDALPGMAAVMVMLSIVYYVFAVMATIMYGDTFDAWFGTLGRSLYTLFQVMTLESWSMGIVRPVMEQHPLAWAFFVPFIIITAFSVLNLFIGLLVNTMQAAVEEETEEEFTRLRDLVRMETDQVDEHVRELLEEMKAMRAELAELRQGDKK